MIYDGDYLGIEWPMIDDFGWDELWIVWIMMNELGGAVYEVIGLLVMIIY